ncbi:MAG: tRNA lysidine(34) synthetase TilS [Thermanaerothrix sp.]|nr:tRNA lysidine(34) synthetase TilS [Thermanaerothrix sp.]
MRLVNEDLLREICGLNKISPILVGVSGGPDSVFLWRRLIELGFPVIVAHFDHGLRSDSRADAEWVEEQANRFCCPFVLGQGDVRGYAEQMGLSLEAAARQMRYRFLFGAAESNACQAVAVGHTADDQVETVMLHLLRGSGLKGLCGMQYRMFLEEFSTTIPLVRPLLGVWRKDIERYLEQAGISCRQDVTNRDPRFLRNRVRHELLPILETFNPKVRRHLWQMSFSLQADYQIINQVVQNAWQRCVGEERPGYLTLKRAEFCIEPEGVQAYLIKEAAGRFSREQYGSNFVSITRVMRFIQEGHLGQVEMEGGVQVVLDRLFVYFLPRGNWPVTPDWPLVSPGVLLRVGVPERLALAQGWVLETSLLHANEISIPKEPDPFTAYLDYATVDLPLLVRTRKPGDRFWPYGMPGPMRLSDFMVNIHLPCWARDRWPLVFSGDALVWVPGFRIAHPHRLTSLTREVLVLRIHHQD